MTDNKNINIELQVGQQIYLSKKIENKDIKIATQIAGWGINDFIIIHSPSLNGLLVDIEEGTSYFVSLFSKNEAIGFKSTVLKTQSVPVSLVFLSYPKKIEDISKRREKRMETLLPAVIQNKKDEGNILASKGLILNLNSNGCLLSTQNSYPIGSKIILSFLLPTKEQIDDLIGYVNNIRESRDLKLIGIEFEEKSKAGNRTKLDKFINPMIN